MNLQSYIKQQAKSKDTEITKIQFLKSVSELLLQPQQNNFKNTIKYLSILANSFHVPIEIKNIRAKKDKNIDKKLLNKTSELIQNGKGYANLLPETFKIIILYAKNNNLQLYF